MPSGVAVSRTLLRNGQNILDPLPPIEDRKIIKQTNYLRARDGSGGSPGKLSATMLASKESRQNNLTTIRIRQRDNSYLYGHDSSSAQDQNDAHINMLWERKRINQEKIEAFREQRL